MLLPLSVVVHIFVHTLLALRLCVAQSCLQDKTIPSLFVSVLVVFFFLATQDK